ncbi:MAG: NADH-quinone oxidoreductase subunit C [FCB group bacterium]|nr:NADH-quinone oxidoreductase subunit C [FCB group bacterium]
MDFKNIKKVLDLRCPDCAVAGEEEQVFFVQPENWTAVAHVLQKDEDLTFDSLMCLTGYHKADDDVLGVAYNFHSMSKLHKVEIRIEVPVSSPEIPSVATRWRAADWHEREAFDMYGIIFTDHPDLKRILLPDDWAGYPLRKNYETPDYYHGMPIPKNKSDWE